eukprot:1186231-Prorocentrum_minimum.AAC.5
MPITARMHSTPQGSNDGRAHRGHNEDDDSRAHLEALADEILSQLVLYPERRVQPHHQSISVRELRTRPYTNIVKF